MPRAKSKSGGRKSKVERVREMLLRRGLPRLQMTLILLVTGLVGFLVSFVLLRAGVGRMWLRYPVAVVVAYIAFLLLLRLWLAYQRWSARRESSHFDVDLPGIDGLSLDLPGGAGDAGGAAFGGGGDFAGAGAGGGWDTTGLSGDAAPESFSGGGGGGGFGLLDGLDIGIDGDEGCAFVIALLLLILGGLLASVYIIYLAPEARTIREVWQSMKSD
jgi:hypothetical protein